MIAITRSYAGEVLATDDTTLPGAYGETGTLAVTDGILVIGTTASDDVAAVIVYPDTLPPDELGSVRDMAAWTWEALAPERLPCAVERRQIAPPMTAMRGDPDMPLVATARHEDGLPMTAMRPEAAPPLAAQREKEMCHV